MCGILGLFGKSYQRGSEALDLMKHRGPDFTGTFTNDNCFLGHQRLSILDLNSRSNQPFQIDDYVMIFNGEIYNYRALISQYSLEVSTNSDTEVLLRLYIKYGAKCLKFLNGMFAFVIYNTRTKEVFAARDRLGIKPLYFRKTNEGVEFSSEVASLLALKNEAFYDFGIRQYRKLRMTVNGDTIYENIRFFPAGHYYENGKINCYWKLNTESKEAPKDDDLKDLLRDSVNLRTISDVPLGTFLSGGLDSTIVTKLVEPEHSWTVGFDELNEFEWGRLAAESIGTNHHEVLATMDEFLSTVEFMVTKRKEPLSVPNEVLIYLMSIKMKEKNTVVLSGEGADELFFGYDRIFKWANAAEKFDLHEFDQHYCYGSHQDNEVLDYALQGVKDLPPLQLVAEYFQTSHLQGLLRRVDASTMLCGVEARVPFVDHRLVEMMAGTPFEWRMGDTFKTPLKRIYKDQIPREIIDRKKIGFPVPLSSIFQSNDSKKTPMDDWLGYNLEILQK